jgi:carboxyl-terminal processing protease
VQNTKKTTLVIVLIAVLSFLAGIPSPGLARSERADVLRNLEKFSRVYQKIVSSYVEEEESDDLIDAAIQAMIEQLDPFSQYMDEDMLSDLMTKTKGEFGGLGIIISNRDNYPTVISPIDDTPAARLGIRGGDKIAEIEGVSTEGWKVQDAVNQLRGAKGTAVNIGIRRYGVDEIIPYQIVRDIIEIKSVPYYYMLPEKIGYIRCTNFGERTALEMRDAMDELEYEGMNALILDL